MDSFRRLFTEISNTTTKKDVVVFQSEALAGVAQIQHGYVASHKIDITHGSDILTYWYVQKPATARAFDSQKDRELVELIYAKGLKFEVGQFESFPIGVDRNYHLERLTYHEFLIKSLR